MKMNMGKLDRAGRIVIASVLLYLALVAGVLGGVIFWIAVAVAAIFVVTAFVGTCPLYRIVGLKTCSDC
ncbi:hypothetical protein TA5114_03363 [Cognatishimia activa]|uniref:Inner membrane protein YgaP-like transmembrane domain-containing protein n=1 Tax=Cognatishimia activa TaxID=1715691 RepID=A0A0P1J3H4_9RHOB|nr:DUF2892 domain-containing protein [Cognatishimia activa]MEE2946040.1 DUF2892 domain-containing protein [Pseudomonadota bacterium]CUK27535.1 hypothetical protein TA5114_03363 [Cognatishimia activa]